VVLLRVCWWMSCQSTEAKELTADPPSLAEAAAIITGSAHSDSQVCLGEGDANSQYRGAQFEAGSAVARPDFARLPRITEGWADAFHLPDTPMPGTLPLDAYDPGDQDAARRIRSVSQRTEGSPAWE